MTKIVLHYTLNGDYLSEWEKFESYAKDNFPTVEVLKVLECGDLYTDICTCIEKRLVIFQK